MKDIETYKNGYDDGYFDGRTSLLAEIIQIAEGPFSPEEVIKEIYKIKE